MAAAQQFLAVKPVSGAPKSHFSLQNSLLAGNLPGDWFDQDCVASQAFREAGGATHQRADKPAVGGLLQFGAGL